MATRGSPSATAAGPRGAGAGIMDLRGLLGLVRRRARMIAAVAALVLAAVLAYLLLSTARYTALTVVIVDPRQQRVLQSEAVLPGIGPDNAAVESQVEVLQSTSLAGKVIGRLGLADDPEFAGPPRLDRLLGLFRAGHESAETAADRVLSRVLDNLRVNRRGLTYVLEIRFTSRDAEKAARVANAIADTYVADQGSSRNGAAAQAADSISERLGALRKRVTEAERAASDFKIANGMVSTGEGRTLVERQVAELNQQLILARARTAETKARLDQAGKASVASLGAGALPEALVSQVVANLRSQYAEAARREAETLSTYGPRHPAVSAMRAQMADIRREIEREIARLTSGIRNEFEVARSREASLERSLADLKAQSATIDGAAVRLRELEREAQASRTLLEQSLLRFRETSEQEGLQRPDAQVLSPATAPLRPSEPRTLVILFAGFAGALLLGVGSAALAETFERGFRTTRDVETSLALPVLGLLPLLDRRALQGPRRRTGAAIGTAGGTRGPAAPAWGFSRYGVDQPLSPFGEALRGLRTRLAANREGACTVLVLLSAMPGEGKSTLATNLGHSFARSGHRTLLVDVDVRKAAPAGGVFPPADGIVSLLEEPGAREPAPVTDPVSGLDILPLGRVDDVAAASELLNGPAMAALIRRFRASHDIVLLDGPPLLPFVDGRTLLGQADLGLLVVAWNRTDPDSAAAALEALGPAAGKVAGVVLNKVDFASAGFSAYGSLYGAAA